MKKSLILAAILAVVSVGAAIAQPRAVGVNIGYGFSASYQHSIGEANLVDVSLELPCFDGIGATATYDWINPFGTAIPWDYAGQWDWYLGVGAGAGLYNFIAMSLGVCNWYVGAVGHVGVSYQFDNLPLQLSADWRPNIGISGLSTPYGSGAIDFNATGLYSGITVGVRYLF